MHTFTIKHMTALYAASALALALAPAAVWAHGKLESAAPASGATVDTAPDAVRLTFNENLEPQFSTIKVSDATGASVTSEKAKVDAANPRVMALSVPKLAAGSYTVQWAVMTADSHKTKGTYAFKVK